MKTSADENSKKIEIAKPMGRRERRSVETREKIFRVALDMFAERGFNATTIDAIAEGADIGKGTFFNYFENKESILLQYREMQMGRVKEFATESMNSNEPLASLFYQLALTMTAEQQKSPNLFQSLMVAILSNEAIRSRVVEGLAQTKEMLSQLIEKRQQSGEILSSLPAKVIARSFQRMIFGTMMLWSLAPERTLEEQLKDMVDVFVGGIEAGSKQTATGRDLL